MSAIIHQLKAGKSSADNTGIEIKILVKQISACLNDELSSLLGCMFDSADDMLFQLAENANSNEDQNDYFDTMRMLRAERKRIGQNFAASLKEYLKNTPDKTQSTEDFAETELSLVDQDEMEEMVAVSSMHSKGMHIYGEAVNHLEARIEFLALKYSDIFNKDALAPKNICESFKSALSDIELSTNNKLVLYKLFDQEVILNLGKMYKKLNQLFIDQGILPQIQLNDISNTPASRAKTPTPPEAEVETDAVYTENPTYNPGQTPTYSNRVRNQAPSYSNANPATNQSGQYTAQNMGHPGNGGAENSGAGISNDGFSGHAHVNGVANGSRSGNNPNATHIVENYLNGTLTASGPGIPASFTTKNNAPSSSGSTQFYDRREVMKALSNLQKNSAYNGLNNEHINADEFKRAILSDMGRRSGGSITKQVNQVDEKTIDFVEMLFNAITEDNSISEAVTNLLLRLQIPVIKVAMLDNSFFSDSEHPCRTTLNLIAHLGRGLSSDEDSLFNDLNNVVEILLNEFDNDIASFETATEMLEGIELYELDQAAEKERETQQRVLRAHAREIVLTELQHHLRNKNLPKSVQNLILRNWSTLMFHRYIKFGKHSEDWSQSVRTVVSLINLLQPIESSHAYNKLNIEKDDVIDTIQSSLLDTMQNPVEIETEINKLFLTFQDMLEQSPFNPDNIQETNSYFVSVEEDNEESSIDDLMEPTLEIEEEIEDPLLEQSSIAHEKINNLPADVRPGVWFKVYNGEESAARRAKLSVIIMEEAKLVFVDRMGAKVIEKDAEEFASELNEDLSLIIADHSAFDHALGMVINSLSAPS